MAEIFFPEKMEHTEGMNADEILKIHDDYIRYIVERIDFAFNGYTNKKKFFQAVEDVVENGPIAKELENEKSAREQAIDQLNEKLQDAGGLFTTVDPETGIVYMHDKKEEPGLLPPYTESRNVIMISTAGIAVSNDGGVTYPMGFTLDDGVAILNKIYAIGIDADHITTGRITDAQGKYSVDLETGEVHMASGEIGGWTFNGSQFYKDVADPDDPNVVYRTLLQGVRDGYLTGTYILACQKQVNGVYDTLFVLKSGGQMMLKGSKSTAMIDVVSDTNSKFHSAIFPSFIRVNGEAKDIATQEMIPDYTEITHGGYNVWKNNNWRASLSASGLSFYDENFNTTAKYEAAPVVTTLSVTYPIQLVKCGNTVTCYGSLTGVSSATTVYLGTVTRKPVADYAVIPVYSTSAPYNQIGTIWISNAGAATLYKSSETSMYVSGTYICQ